MDNHEKVPNGKGLPKLSQGDERMLKDLSSVTINEKIGSGANGSVFQGIFQDQKVAIKLIEPANNEKSLSDQCYRSFIKEGKLMLKLCSKKHRNFVQVHAICISRENPGIIMEFADLGTLLQNLRTGPSLALNVQFKLIIGIARGLQFLHKKDIIHRDIAARNILLNANMVPMISDFGLSREVEIHDAYSSTGRDSLPLKWMAPEAIKTNLFSKFTDVWSLGIVIWEIVTSGKEPHEAIEVVEAKIQIRDHFLTPTIPHGTDSTMAVIMTQCWYKDPEMRPSPKDVIYMAEERDL